METMERAEAANKGLTKYFTGRPCKRGHISHRYTYNGNCAKCASSRSNTYSKKMRDARAVAMDSATTIRFDRSVPAYLVETLDAVIAADALSPRPCPNRCPPGTVCAICDRGVIAAPPPPPAPPKTAGTCPHGHPPSVVCTICDTGTGGE